MIKRAFMLIMAVSLLSTPVPWARLRKITP